MQWLCFAWLLPCLAGRPCHLAFLEVFADLFGEAFGHGGDGGEVFYGGAADAFYRAERSEQESSAAGADAGDFFDGGAGHSFIAEFAVEGNGEAVGFVS